MKEQFALGKYSKVVDQALAEAFRNSYADRIWSKDSTLWKDDPSHRKIIENALGWLVVAQDMIGHVAEIQAFANFVRQQGFTRACLLGMGGSSLCPEVCAATFGTKRGYLDLAVLDTTDPATIITAERTMDLSRTLFIVSSKSGGTIESSSLQKYFYEKLKRIKSNNAGEHFIAITDPGTSLAKLAQDQQFLYTFLNPRDIGGRYSALSYFGLVPMALLGLDLVEVLRRANRMAERCKAGADPGSNPGLNLGVTLGALAKTGLDKVTFVTAPEISAFGCWIEQLVAESTGKEGIGILPIEGEKLGAPLLYQADRVFVQLDLAGKEDPSLNSQLHALEKAGHPLLRWELEETLDLNGEFFLWEYATAAAAAVLRINPFDQPNVQESKDNSQRLIRQYRDTGGLNEASPLVSTSNISLYCSPELARVISPALEVSHRDPLQAALAAFFKMAQPRDYVALLAYLERSTANQASLGIIRGFIHQKMRIATTLGFGPRFLHSTGQLHKGGANNGLFLQITAKDRQDLDIPGEGYSFGTLKKAQAIGDLQSLVMHGRRALRLHIDGDVGEGLDCLARIVECLY